MEEKRVVEEQLTLALEEDKQRVKEAFKKEEEEITHNKEEAKAKLEQESHERQRQLHLDLIQHEVSQDQIDYM